jgi:hypothetical protein
MGSAIGLAAIAVAIDHTRHRLPEPVPAATAGQDARAGVTEYPVVDLDESPCGLGSSPCGLGENPCGLGSAPCGF